MLRIGPPLAALRAGLAMLVLTACAEAPPAALPTGAWITGRSNALREIALRAARLEGTPLAREARALAAALPACEIVDGHAPDAGLDAAVAALACRESGGPFAGLDAERAGRDLLFAQPLRSGGALHGSLTLAGDALDLELRWPDARAEGALGLLVPGDRAAGPAVLADADRLLHVRVRPAGGLDLAALVPAGSQADQLFALRSQIFAGAVLDGTWEAAAYVPSDEDPLPPLALAVGVTLRAPAVAAADRFVANLEAAWPVHRSPFAVGRAEGVCLPDLNILPGFAPCFVATRDALVVGWNAESVRRALAPADPRADGDAPARLELDLELFERADEILSRQVAETLRADALRWPWRHVQAEGSREGDTLVLRVALSGGPRE